MDCRTDNVVRIKDYLPPPPPAALVAPAGPQGGSGKLPKA
jgi:hypothetical protein